MNFEVKKAENCFTDAENYEYRIAISGSELLDLLGITDKKVPRNTPEASSKIPSDKRANPTPKTFTHAVSDAKLAEGSSIKVRINTTLRRPTFYLELPSGEQIKGLLDKKIIKVGYLPKQAREQKVRFESWLKDK